MFDFQFSIVQNQSYGVLQQVALLLCTYVLAFLMLYAKKYSVIVPAKKKKKKKKKKRKKEKNKKEKEKEKQIKKKKKKCKKRRKKKRKRKREYGGNLVQREENHTEH